jgi:hypothetical protein
MNSTLKGGKIVMKVKCISNMGDGLSKQSIKAGRNLDSSFHLKIGDVYVVYGINQWRNTLNYLTMNKADSMPIWSPAELFEVVDEKIPADWYFKYLGHTENLLNAIWGYKELAMNPQHYDGVIGEDKKDLALFFEKKKAMDSLSK